MKRIAFLLAVVPAIALGSGPAQITSPVNASGAVTVSATAGLVCKSAKETVTSVATTSTAVPATDLASRGWIEICSSAENSTATALLKCRSDNTTVAMGTSAAGVVLKVGDCVRFGVPSGVKCISDQAGGVAAHATECVISY